MRTWLSLAAAASVMVAGCNKSPEFKSIGPPTEITIKQGNKETVKLSIERGKDFKKDVNLWVKTSDDKIKAELNKTEIKASEGNDFNVTVEVAKDARLGNHEITVFGDPKGGGEATAIGVFMHVVAP